MLQYQKSANFGVNVKCRKFCNHFLPKIENPKLRTPQTSNRRKFSCCKCAVLFLLVYSFFCCPTFILVFFIFEVLVLFLLFHIAVLDTLLTQNSCTLFPMFRLISMFQHIFQVFPVFVIKCKIIPNFSKTSFVFCTMKTNCIKNVIFSKFTFAFPVLRSPWLLQMLITDDPGTVVIVMATIQSTNRMSL